MLYCKIICSVFAHSKFCVVSLKLKIFMEKYINQYYLFQLTKEFANWQTFVVGGACPKRHAKQSASQVRAILREAKVKHPVTGMRGNGPAIKDQWLDKVVKEDKLKGKTIRNYIYSSSKFALFLKSRHGECIGDLSRKVS